MDLRLQEMRRHFSWDRQQTCLQRVCPSEVPSVASGCELQEAVRRLCSIKEAEKELDSWFQVQSAADTQPMAKEPKSLPSKHTERRGASNVEL